MTEVRGQNTKVRKRTMEDRRQIWGISNTEQGISNDEGQKEVNGYQVIRKSG